MLLHLTWAVAAHHLLELLELSKREVFSILMCHPVLSMARYQTVGHPQVPGYKGSPRPKTAWRVLVLEKGTREYDRLRVLPYPTNNRAASESQYASAETLKLYVHRLVKKDGPSQD